MSRNHLAGLMALALSALLAAGAALWLGTRPVMPLPAPGPMQPELEAALAQLDRAASGEAHALPELRARLLALAELQDRAGEPLRVEALLHGLAGRIEGTLATLEGGPRAAAPEGLLPLAALAVAALALLTGLLLARRRTPPAPAQAETPAWSETLRAEVQAALALARQAQEEAARATSRAGDQQDRLAHRVRLLAERLEGMPAGAADPRLPALLDRVETLAAGIGQVAGRAEAAEARQARGLERLEEAVDNLNQLPPTAEGAAPRLAALLPAFEAAAAECRATAPLLGELATLAQQAMARVTDEAVVRIGVAAERMATAGHAALTDAQAALAGTSALLDAGLRKAAEAAPIPGGAPAAAQLDRLAEAAARLERLADGMAEAPPLVALSAEVARVAAAAGEVERVVQGLGAGLPVADLAAQVDRVTAAAAHVERAAQGLEGGLPVLELTAQIARLDAVAGAVETAAGRIPVAEMQGQVDRLSAGLAVQLSQVSGGVAALEQGARQMVHALPLAALDAQVARVEAVATALEEGAQHLGEALPLDALSGQLARLEATVEASAQGGARLAETLEGHVRRHAETALELAGAAAAVREAGQALDASARALPDTRAALAPLLAELHSALPAREPTPSLRRPSALPEPRGSIAASLVAELGAPRYAPLSGALRRVGQVEEEVTQLLDEAETLAERAVQRPGEGWPAPVSGRVGEVLGSIQSTIERLQTVATALAVAADAPGGAAEVRGAA